MAVTCGYLDEVIDEESYQIAKADLVVEKNRLKQEKERLDKSWGVWNEPYYFAQNRFFQFLRILRFHSVFLGESACSHCEKPSCQTDVMWQRSKWCAIQVSNL